MKRSDLRLDREAAAAHLAALDEDGTSFIFALIPEASWCPYPRHWVRHLYGTLAEIAGQLDRAQQEGCAVHVTVQAMAGRRRRKAEVSRIRAVWCERDQPGKSLSLLPSLRVRSSPGKGHDYILSDAADPLTTEEAERILRQIVADYGGDPAARDLARTLRLAGTWHLKGEPHRVEIIGGTGERYSRARILAAFPAPPPRPRPPRPARIEHSDRYLSSAAQGLAEELADAGEHTRNATLNWCAYRLGQLGMQLEPTMEMLEPTALQIGLEPDEVKKTITSGWTAGAAKMSGRAA
jgi:hypothetical protein